MIRKSNKQTAMLLTGNYSPQKHPEILESVTDSRVDLEQLKVICFPLFNNKL